MKKLFLGLALFATVFLTVPLPPAAHATGVIARGSTAAGVGTATSPLNYTLNNVAGTELIVEVRTAGTPFTSCTFNTAVSYNGVALTLLDKRNGGGSDNCVYFWYLDNPATGSHTVAVTFSGSSASARSSARTYTGAGGVEIATFNSCEQTTGTQLTCAATTQHDNDWMVGVTNSQAGSIIAGTGSSIAAQDDSGTGGILDSNAAKTPTGSYSLQNIYGSTGAASLIVAAIYPTQPAAATNSFWQFLGCF